MSGFSNVSRGGSKFANFKEGLIVTEVNGEKKTFTTLTGFLLDMDIQDVEAGKDYEAYRKLVLYIGHDSGVTELGFNFASGYADSFCRILPNIDPTREISISGSLTKMKDSDKKYASIFIEQEGQPVKWFFSSKTEHGKLVPEVEKNVVGRGKNAKTIYDRTNRLEFFEKVIVKKMSALQSAHGENAVKDWERNIKASDKEAIRKSSHVSAEDITEPIDDLPF